MSAVIEVERFRREKSSDCWGRTVRERRRQSALFFPCSDMIKAGFGCSVRKCTPTPMTARDKSG